MILRLAWQQLVVERRRLLAALAGIGFAVMLQMMQFGFRDALFDSAVVLHKRLVADLVLASPLYESEVSPAAITRRRLYQALAEPAADSVTPLYLSIAPFKNPVTQLDKPLIVIGFDPNEYVLNIPSVVNQAHLLKVPDVALFDRLARPEFGPIVELLATHGDITTELSRRQIRVVGLFELGTSFAGAGHVIVSDQTFRRVFNRPEGIYELGLIRLKPGSDVAAVQQSLKQRLPDDVRVLTVPEFAELEKTFWRNRTPIGPIFMMGAMIGLLVGAVIVYQILYTDVSDHLSEYATLKAMGYSDRQLSAIVLEQALILSVIGFPIGFALAQIVYRLARGATRLPIEMTTTRALMVLSFTIVMCAVSGLMALRKLRSADPAEVF